MSRIVLAAMAASASAFSPVASFSPVAAPQRVSSPQMSTDGFSRRAAFAAIFAVPAAANAMAVSDSYPSNRAALSPWPAGCLSLEENALSRPDARMDPNGALCACGRPD
jgi:hypothetical protein